MYETYEYAGYIRAKTAGVSQNAHPIDFYDKKFAEAMLIKEASRVADCLLRRLHDCG